MENRDWNLFISSHQPNKRKVEWTFWMFHHKLSMIRTHWNPMHFIIEQNNMDLNFGYGSKVKSRRWDKMYIFCMCPFLTFVLLFKITLPSLGWLAIGYTVGILCVPKRSVKECRDTGPRTISLSQSRSGLIKSNQIVLYAQVIEGQ